MDMENLGLQILTTVSRMEGELVEMRKLYPRVSKLEVRLACLNGGWAVLLAATFYFFSQIAGR